MARSLWNNRPRNNLNVNLRGRRHQLRSSKDLVGEASDGARSKHLRNQISSCRGSRLTRPITRGWRRKSDITIPHRGRHAGHVRSSNIRCQSQAHQSPQAPSRPRTQTAPVPARRAKTLSWRRMGSYRRGREGSGNLMSRMSWRRGLAQEGWTMTESQTRRPLKDRHAIGRHTLRYSVQIHGPHSVKSWTSQKTPSVRPKSQRGPPRRMIHSFGQ